MLPPAPPPPLEKPPLPWEPDPPDPAPPPKDVVVVVPPFPPKYAVRGVALPPLMYMVLDVAGVLLVPPVPMV